MLGELERQYGSFSAAEPIYNGRSAAEFQPEKKAPFVLTAGRLWDDAKNAGILRQVAGKIPWQIYAAGETRDPDGKGIDLTGLVQLGRLDAAVLAQWYGRASIFVLPARYEPFGLSALEAALAGCALVLGDIPSLREIWSDAALFAPPDDAEKIHAALRELIEKPSLRDELSRRARSRAGLFTSERMALGYLRLYERLLSGTSQSVSEYFAQRSAE
jgi:glycosyltransferase involved in cell wall biosynthesis